MKSKHLKILLVEDNKVDALYVETLLKGSRVATFSVEHVTSLAAAMQKLQAQPPDLVFLDLNLTDQEGFETFEKLHTLASEVPIIVLSGVDDEEVATRVLQEGAQDFLYKGKLDSTMIARTALHAVERSEAQAKLLSAEEKYRSIYQNAVEGIFQTSPEGRYLTANPALARIYGYDSPEDLMNSISDISRMLYVEPGRREEFVRLMQKNDVVNAFESQIYKKNGEKIWISENVRAVRDGRGRILYYEGTVEDVTERKSAQDRLAQSESLYHSLVDAIEQAIFRKDLNERFTFGNQRFCDTLGKPLAEIIGKTDFDFFPPALAEKYQRDDQYVITTEKNFEAIEEYKPASAPDEVHYVHVLKTPLRDPSGKIIGLQGLFWDITEKKQAEERERRANEELARNREELRRKNQIMEEDLKMANEIQQAMLPQQYPVFPPGVPPENSLLRFCHHYTPTGSVGGDFFSVFPLSDHVGAIFICDVMGHGVRSALVTAMIRALVEELRPLAYDPGQLLTRINGDLRNILKQTGSPLFTTAFFAVADLERRVFLYANAGHPKPFFLNRHKGTAERLRSADGKRRPAMGLFADSVYKTFERPMEPGDMLLLFTDGVFEVEGPDDMQFSQDMLLDIARRNASQSIQHLLTTILKEIKGFTAQETFADDICLVGLEVADRLA